MFQTILWGFVIVPLRQGLIVFAGLELARLASNTERDVPVSASCLLELKVLNAGVVGMCHHILLKANLEEKVK